MCTVNKLVKITNPCNPNNTETAVFDANMINGFDWAKYSAISDKNVSAFNFLIKQRAAAYNSILISLKQEIAKNNIVFDEMDINKRDKTSGKNLQVFETVSAQKGIRISRRLTSDYLKLQLEKVSFFAHSSVTNVILCIATLQGGEWIYENFTISVIPNSTNYVDISNMRIVSEGDIFIFFKDSYSLKSSNIVEFCALCNGSKAPKPFKTENITVTNYVGDLEYTKNNAPTSANGIVVQVGVSCDFEAFLCRSGIYEQLAEPLLRQMEINLMQAKKTTANINYFSIVSDLKDFDYQLNSLKFEVSESLKNTAAQMVRNQHNACQCLKSTRFRNATMI